MYMHMYYDFYMIGVDIANQRGSYYISLHNPGFHAIGFHYFFSTCISVNASILYHFVKLVLLMRRVT